MYKKRIKVGNRKEHQQKEHQTKSDAISYRLKCARTANGLSHFVMYGDVPKRQMPI